MKQLIFGLIIFGFLCFGIGVFSGIIYENIRLNDQIANNIIHAQNGMIRVNSNIYYIENRTQHDNTSRIIGYTIK